jgi:NADH-quinone oxidoreductase subunit H
MNTSSPFFALFAYLIFPGFIFTAVIGMLASWVDRKVTARVQWRVGPPLLQPLYDVVKLLGKETIVPRGGSRTTFLIAPVLGLVGVTLVSTLVWISILFPQASFRGDLIVILYFLMVPSLAVVLGGFASRNPIASLGASREMKLMLAYELPFLLSVFTVVIKADYTLGLRDLMIRIHDNGMLASPSIIIALIVSIMVMQAKLTLVPFDIPEAETEIMSGPFVEYSGTPLALFKLTRMMMLFTVPMVLVTLFMGGAKFWITNAESGASEFHYLSILWLALKYVALLVIVTLIRNTNPRVRIDQAMRFFWGPMTVLAIIAVVLAFLGL